MKGVQCYELFGGIALKNHAFSFFFSLHNHQQQHNLLFKATTAYISFLSSFHPILSISPPANNTHHSSSFSLLHRLLPFHSDYPNSTSQPAPQMRPPGLPSHCKLCLLVPGCGVAPSFSRWTGVAHPNLRASWHPQ